VIGAVNVRFALFTTLVGVKSSGIIDSPKQNRGRSASVYYIGRVRRSIYVCGRFSKKNPRQIRSFPNKDEIF
ncbi:MAG TPA: hypothetical protein O0X20_06675, partial [Methanocorpusculum sp.]|nr:hypothetical protein [Methanocorpusculum sp.]